MSTGKAGLPCYIISVPSASGRVSLVCIATNVRSKILQKYLPIGLGLGLLIIAGVLLLIRHGRQIMNDLANARVHRIKRRYASDYLFLWGIVHGMIYTSKDYATPYAHRFGLALYFVLRLRLSQMTS